METRLNISRSSQQKNLAFGQEKQAARKYFRTHFNFDFQAPAKLFNTKDNECSPVYSDLFHKADENRQKFYKEYLAKGSSKVVPIIERGGAHVPKFTVKKLKAEIADKAKLVPEEMRHKFIDKLSTCNKAVLEERYLDLVLLLEELNDASTFEEN